MFPKLQINDFITIADDKEIRFFLKDGYSHFDGIVYLDENYGFVEEDITEVWRQVDNDIFKCIYRKENRTT